MMPKENPRIYHSNTTILLFPGTGFQGVTTIARSTDTTPKHKIVSCKDGFAFSL
jgi:hypothetical protein